MSARRRAALLALAGTTALAACNGLTGIGDYAVRAGATDASPDDAPADPRDATTAGDAGGDAPDGCAIVDHGPRSDTTCADDINGYVGSSMASLAYGFDGYHCVDVTEVTVAQYQTFLTERGATNTCGQPPECAWNTTYAPAAAGGAPDGSTPQVNVDWCDAFMYCRWAGKHLCGSMAHPGQPSTNLTVDQAGNETVDLWYALCLGGPEANHEDFFYGPVPVPGTCQDAKRSGGRIAAVGTAPGCHGTSFAAPIYDMAGNAAEWEWRCADGGAEATCATRGGSFLDSDPMALQCNFLRAAARSTQSPEIGFRCCVR